MWTWLFLLHGYCQTTQGVSTNDPTSTVDAIHEQTYLVRLANPEALPTEIKKESLGGPYFRLTFFDENQRRFVEKLPALFWFGLERRQHVHLDQINEPLENLQWYLHPAPSAHNVWPLIDPLVHIHIDTAWSFSEGEPETILAVLDTGVVRDHPDLPAETLRQGWDFIDNDSDASPDQQTPEASHGTAVAALMAAPRNALGIVGVCPRCSILPIRLIASDQTVRDGDIVAALVWATEHADIINASWSFDDNAYVSPAVMDALLWAENHGRQGNGTVIIFSAGNRARTIDDYVPQALPTVLTVGATDEMDLPTSYSNFGPFLSLMAPGGTFDSFALGARIARAKIVTADMLGISGNNPERDQQLAPTIYLDESYTAAFVGTSGAAPLVAGAAGLLKSYAPELSASQIRWLLTESAKKIGSLTYDANGHNDTYGYGRLDAGAAMTLLAQGNFCSPEPELCFDDVDNDCDRLTDTSDSDCGGQVVAPFDLSFAACRNDSDCGDGFCLAQEGAAKQRVCSASCDFDCSVDSRCVGRSGAAVCRKNCTTTSQCSLGFVCALPDDAFVTNPTISQKVCLAQCASHDDCLGTTCVWGVCGALQSAQSANEGCNNSANRLDPTALVAWLLLWSFRHIAKKHDCVN